MVLKIYSTPYPKNEPPNSLDMPDEPLGLALVVEEYQPRE